MLISKLPGRDSAPAQFFCASSRTRKALRQEEPLTGEPEVDPWNGGKDPWSNWRSKSSQAAQPSAPSESKLAQLRKELVGDVNHAVQQQLAQQPPQPASTGQADPRLQRLEVQVTELQAQTSKFEGWFSTFGKQVSENHKQVEGMSKALQAQQQDLQQVKGEVSRQADAVQSAGFLPGH